jgi:hypothetical protein
MTAFLTVDGQIQKWFDDDSPRVGVSFEADRIPCVNCGNEIAEHPDEWLHNAGPTCPDRVCPESAWPEDDQECYATPPPLHWCNGAEITVNPERDEITVSISVDDPNGGFALSVYKVPDTEETRRDSPATAGRFLMTVPHAQMSGPHMPLRELMPGVFVIGR